MLHKTIIYICKMYVILIGICIFTTENNILFNVQIISGYNLK